MSSTDNHIATAMEALKVKAAKEAAKRQAKKEKAEAKKLVKEEAGLTPAEIHAIGVQRRADEKYAEEVARYEQIQKWMRRNGKFKGGIKVIDSRGIERTTHPHPQLGGKNPMPIHLDFTEHPVTTHYKRYGQGNNNGVPKGYGL